MQSAKYNANNLYHPSLLSPSMIKEKITNHIKRKSQCKNLCNNCKLYHWLFNNIYCVFHPYCTMKYLRKMTFCNVEFTIVASTQKVTISHFPFHVGHVHTLITSPSLSLLRQVLLIKCVYLYLQFSQREYKCALIREHLYHAI